MEPRHAQRRGDLVDRRVQGQVVVDDVAQRGAHARLGLADQRRHDRLLVVADVLQAGSLRIGEHQHLEAATAVMALRLQGEIPVAGDVAGGCDAAVLQRRRTVRAIMPPERRQAVARLREGLPSAAVLTMVSPLETCTPARPGSVAPRPGLPSRSR
ncbi:hypothetical protein G6F35_015837 [Rhizopus arrhizus]|nr:hypothetical protein G6F35_015837 [Rhizopus arrhizus]